MLERSFGALTVTKDGVSVAKEIELKDSSRLPRSSTVRRTSPPRPPTTPVTQCTTATVLAQAIVQKA